MQNLDPTILKLYIAILVAVIGLIFSIVNFILGKYITAKLTNNDLKHVDKDIKELRENEKEYRSDLRKELNKIFRRLGKIEKQIIRRNVVCEINHPKK